MPIIALCLRSGSWLAWANDTAAHYAAIHCPRQQTIRPAVQSADIGLTMPQLATLGLLSVTRKLQLISHAAEGRRLSWSEYMYVSNRRSCTRARRRMTKSSVPLAIRCRRMHRRNSSWHSDLAVFSSQSTSVKSLSSLTREITDSDPKIIENSYCTPPLPVSYTHLTLPTILRV